jgi:hypothetical protein
MGGFIVQKYLEAHQAPAGVLLASTPQRGSFAFNMRLTRRHPWLTTKGLITGNSLLPVGTPELARESFFSPQTPESDVVRYAARLNGESQRVALDMMLEPEWAAERIHTWLETHDPARESLQSG